ncbi:YeiH family protein [Pelagicoccus albus]|uniref:YeiH family protein n=1 Tax=Pelagicoccus albus TaxID=415222 RepID=UPI001FE68B6C|nr:putative sulfate exporter family transporter [Pelagicoccus albus]
MVLLGLACGGLGVPAAVALALGTVASLGGLAGQRKRYHSLSRWFLQGAIIAMAAGIDFPSALRVGVEGLGVTFFSIVGILLLGILLGRLLGVARDTALLVSVGTAVCGGSAIAAIAGVIKPGNQKIATSLTVVFTLNGLALFVFPMIGHGLGLSQASFAWWSALSIHDTSSVVGAASAYGESSLQLATTVKLARALWIIPIAIVFGVLRRDRVDSHRSFSAFPWFVLVFVGVVALFWGLPGLRGAGSVLSGLGKSAMVVALFFIGACIDFKGIRAAGARAFLLGVSLWLPTAALALVYVYHFH